VKEVPATSPVGRRATFAFRWLGTFLIVRSGSFGNYKLQGHKSMPPVWRD